jgi:hypothetical protein
VTASVALARHRLSRAYAALKEADILIAEDQMGGTLNRLY